MKLIIDGQVNVYYVQTLCMIFYPGEKFSEDQDITSNTPILQLNVKSDDVGYTVNAVLTQGEKYAQAERSYSYRDDIDRDKLLKLALGNVILAVCGEVCGYRPSWGMLTGVRPSKVATDLLKNGVSKTRVKRILTNEYFVIPKKAALATEVALNESRIIASPGKKDCSVYISIPFCPTRCAYCSFVSYTSKRLLSLIPEYLAKLCDEIKEMFACINRLGLCVKTVYIGGGTPTSLTADQLRLLLSVISESTDVTKLEEYTLESGRPDTITAEKFAVAKQYGVNRVSVNPQILCDEVLEGIGRGHKSEDFFNAFRIAREADFKVINTDLIAGLPGDKFSTFAASYDKILALRPENITVHTFCVKKSAEILQKDAKVYDIRGGDTGKCVDYSQIKAMHEGYKPYYMYRQKNTVGNYENVGLATEGNEGLYNIYMMEEVHSIFAAGAGAVTKAVDYAPADGSKPYIKRFFNDKYPYEYLRSETLGQKFREIERFYQDRGLIN
ncbi:MAG: coproporphyrinogen dehydrogenase HemZ [Clostridia bacterium]|nr:coproporphyrinogen dehydrogenase HemZ [Clostridia bacterium]